LLTRSVNSLSGVSSKTRMLSCVTYKISPSVSVSDLLSMPRVDWKVFFYFEFDIVNRESIIIRDRFEPGNDWCDLHHAAPGQALLDRWALYQSPVELFIAELFPIVGNFIKIIRLLNFSNLISFYFYLGRSDSSDQYSVCAKGPLAIAAMIAELPPFKTGKHNSESASTIDRVITPLIMISFKHYL